MIFKINDKYWTQTEQYLQTHYRNNSYSYTEHPTDSTILLQLTSSANHMPNICHTIATKLLSEYNSTLKDKKWNTISEYLQSVLQIFSNTGVVDVQNQYQCQYLNYLLLAADYQQLKLRIWAKKAILEKAVQGVKVQFRDFGEAVKEEEGKLAEGVRNVDLRLKLIQTQRPQCSQELERVKNLLKNGVWGLRAQLQQKIQKIRHLQKEIREAKQVSKTS